MGCSRPSVIEKPEMPIDNKAIDVAFVPREAVEGQMDFLNVGATTILLRFGQTANGSQINATLYSVKLAAGAAYTHDGLVPGFITAWSSADGGKLSTFIAYR